MKHYILSGMALLALMIASCSEDNLDIPQKGVVSYESFYSDPNNAENAVAYVYQAGMFSHWCGLGYQTSDPWIWQGAVYNLQEAPSDDVYWASEHKGDHVEGLQLNEFNQNFTYNSAAPTVVYPAMYNMIRPSNLLLDNYKYNMVSGDSILNNTVNRAISEAKVSRAYAHFFLATYWNNPPLVDHQLPGDAKPGNTPHDEIIDWCIAELEEAIPYLPSKSGLEDPNMVVRFSKEFAYALKGKIEVFAGKYKEAKESLKKVIDSGLYDLVDGQDMHKIYHAEGDCSKEWLFQYNFIDNESLGCDPKGVIFAYGASGHFSPHFVKSTSWRNLRAYPDEVDNAGWGSINPSKSFGDALIANDGMDSWRRQSWIVTYDEMLNGKVIGTDTVLTISAKKTMDKRGINKDGVFGCVGYWQYKRLPLNKEQVVKAQNTQVGGTEAVSEVNYPIMRYAEVLLLYAEACAIYGDADGSGFAALKKVQERAGSKHVSERLSLEEVKNEKRFECFLEGTRFADLVRWGDAPEVLGEQGKRVPTAFDKMCCPIGTKVEDGTVTENTTEHVLAIQWNEYNTEYGFKAGKHEYMPYPFSVISVNDNIEQNPGWEQ